MSESNLTHSDFKLDNIKTLYKCQLCNELNNGKINDNKSVCNKCKEEFEIEYKNIFQGLQSKYGNILLKKHSKENYDNSVLKFEIHEQYIWKKGFDLVLFDKPFSFNQQSFNYVDMNIIPIINGQSGDIRFIVDLKFFI